jgi:hypothetical protein
MGEESCRWMLKVLQCKVDTAALRMLTDSDHDARQFLHTLKNGKLKDRNKVLAVLADRRGISRCVIARFLHIAQSTVSSHCHVYSIYGRRRLFGGFYDRPSKSDDELLRNTLFSVLHTPPSAFGINRTTWRMPDLRRVLANKGHKACPQVIRKIIRAAG